jgi:ATP-dependent Clp protease ATP-binding subunit ClpC
MKKTETLDNLSNHVKNVISKSIVLATELKHKYIEPAHIFLCLSQEQGSIAKEILFKYNITNEAILDALESKVTLEKFKGSTQKQSPNLSPVSQEILEQSLKLALESKNNYVGTEHLLLSVLLSKDIHIANILKFLKTATEDLKNEIKLVIKSTNEFPSIDELPNFLANSVNKHLPNNFSKPQQDITTFTINLTDKKIQKDIDPVIGRKKEIDRIIHILCRRNKNNPLLLGEPGVGKTAIVEGLAKRISTGDIPHVLKHKKILYLDLTNMIAGTMYRGEFEDRLKHVIETVSNNPDIILFIDEIHNIIGAGSNSGTMDAANILKPALARGKIRCIGATTLDEYQKYISSDPALERRFQSISIHEPSKEDAKNILLGIKKYYETYHYTNITDEAIEFAVDLSSKYIHNNFLPDKAIDLIDEACALVKTQRKQIKEEKRLDSQHKKLQKIKDNMLHFAKINDKDEVTKMEKEIKTIETELQSFKKEIAALRPKTKVSKKHIASVLSNKIDIDTEILLENNQKRLTSAKKSIQQKIIGQNHVIDSIFDTLEHQDIGLLETTGPKASFLFAGPSGVGKTALAKYLSDDLILQDKALIKVNMSEFGEQHGISKLLGSPAGYVGYKQRNHFLDALKTKPYSIVLFDEIDKAHPDVLRLLQKILEEGEITLGDGKILSFKHAIVILTANIDLEQYTKSNFGFSGEQTYTKNRQHIHNHLQEKFTPELIGRLHTVSIFSPLQKEHLKQIITLTAKKFNKTLEKNNAQQIQLQTQTLETLLNNSYKKELGARNIETLVKQEFFKALKQHAHNK